MASISQAGEVPLVIERGPDAAGDGYLVMGSRTGSSPGIPIGLAVLPLVPDGYTVSGYVGANGTVFQSTLGLLDAQGSGRAVLDLPPGLPLALTGLTLWHAALIWDPSSIIYGATQATSLVLAP